MKAKEVRLKGRSFRRFVLNEYKKGNITSDQMREAGFSKGLIYRLNHDAPNIGAMVDTFQRMYEIATGNKIQF